MERSDSFGYWLRRRRKARDLTQQELADRAGCTAAMIRRIEADERRPSRELAARLADLLAVPADERAAFLLAARAQGRVDQLAIAPTPLVAHPSGTLTFLFSDIAGSTRRWEQHPSAMSAALARHDALLRAALEGHGGTVFKTVGDAFCAAFPTAGAALAAALSAQRALQAEAWEVFGLPADAPLAVRMALHSGAAESRDGDFFGSTLNRVARLLATAHGGQILLSLAAAELARDHMPPDIALRDLGQHQLKDLTRPEQIFQLAVPDLPADFPALRSLDARPHNLPAQPNQLIGRQQECEELVALLRRPQSRLVTLTGPGGTGKTRLALQAAAELFGDFADGVWFVDLAPVSDPQLVLPAIVRTLGLHQGGEVSVHLHLAAYLKGRQTLLLLDNFEQVLDAAPELAALLAAVAGLKLLVTSRAVLHLQAEQEYAVAPLSVPVSQLAPVTPAWLRQYEAVQLFVERACAARPDFAVTNENAPVVAAICAHLDGLPLAIELAAARVRTLSPAALLTRLGKRLEALTGGPRDLPARQQTLRATIAWSYQLLDPAEQTLFARLGVFLDGWTLVAAESVASDEQLAAEKILGLLEGLVEQSLVKLAVEATDEPRFTMLETLREYALEQLTAQGEQEELRRRHAQYFVTLGEQAEPKLHGPEARAWMDRLEADQDNLRAALEWSRTTGDAQRGLRLAKAVWWFWELRGHRREGRALLDALLALPEEEEPSAVRGWALAGAACMANSVTDTVRSMPAIEACLALAQRLEDERLIARALTERAFVSYTRGELAAASEDLAQSLALARGVRDERWSAVVLWEMARIEIIQVRKEQLLAESLARARAQGDTHLVAAVISDLGLLALERGDQSMAERLLGDADALADELGDLRTGGFARLSLGDLALSQWKLNEAGERFRESLELGRRTNETILIAFSVHALANTMLWSGDPAGAERLLSREVEGLPREHDRAWAEVYLGLAAEAQGRMEEAERFLAAGLAKFRAIPWARGTARALRGLADLALRRNHQAQAAALLAESLTIYKQQENAFGIAACLVSLASLMEQKGSLTEAARLWGAAKALGAGERPERTEYQYDDRKQITAAYARLATREHAVDWAAGRNLTLDAATTEALWLLNSLTSDGEHQSGSKPHQSN